MSMEKPGVFPPKFVPLPLRALSDSRILKPAIIDCLGTHAHGDLLLRAVSLSKRLIDRMDQTEIQKAGQVAILVPNDHR